LDRTRWRSAAAADRDHLSYGRGPAAVRGRFQRLGSEPRRARFAVHVHAGGRRGADSHPGAGEEEAMTSATRRRVLWAATVLIAAAAVGEVAARGGGRGGGGGYNRGGAAA